MKKTAALFLCALFTSSFAWAAVITKPVEYKHGETVLEGFLAYDDAIGGPRPGVLLVHEWRGVNDHVKNRAELIAALGYTALAIDMYGKGVYAKDHEEAAKLSGMYKDDRSLMRERARAGLDALLAQPGVDPKRVAAIGYCFGGTTVLEMARVGMPLKLVASFHGALGTPLPAIPGQIKAKVVVFQGGEDKFTLGDLPAFEQEMRSAKVDWTVMTLGGAVHSFTVADAGQDPSTGVAHHPLADRRSWMTLKVFLDEVFNCCGQ